MSRPILDFSEQDSTAEEVVGLIAGLDLPAEVAIPGLLLAIKTLIEEGVPSNQQDSVFAEAVEELRSY